MRQDLAAYKHHRREHLGTGQSHPNCYYCVVSVSKTAWEDNTASDILQETLKDGIKLGPIAYLILLGKISSALCKAGKRGESKLKNKIEELEGMLRNAERIR